VEIAKRKLEERGYEVMVAGDGEEALERLKSKTPDLILLDVQMPKMNGYSFLIEKNKFPEFTSIPVIVLTAYNEMERIFQRHHIKAYLLKPLKLQDLLSKVQEILESPAT
jgi:CheY-like chemotaxis protein